ncbi:AraC family transcriptional regulator, partial [Acetobacter fabarum]
MKIPGQFSTKINKGDVWKDVDVQIFTRPVQEDEILVPAVAEPLLVWVIRGEANI